MNVLDDLGDDRPLGARVRGAGSLRVLVVLLRGWKKSG